MRTGKEVSPTEGIAIAARRFPPKSRNLRESHKGLIGTERRRKSLVGLRAGWTCAFRKWPLQKVAKERKITKP